MSHDSSTDRRDVTSRDDLLFSFRQELRHVPGLALTPDQVSRLFDVPREICSRLLSELAAEGTLLLRPDGRFVAPAR